MTREWRTAGVLLMLLAVLAAGVLYSAGSVHHAHGHVHHVCTPHDVVKEPAHEHRHGNEWVPNLGHRARPMVQSALVTIVPVVPARAVEPCAGVGERPDPDLKLLGVLRV
ncbi:hypothetical protein AB0M02_29050 [Actinoplanes sp. NPDC051861]|uniref:hypothetical protein n=1 Tax=Actinoplanes sp. NPDC051861 TaxID=3155170 RepID=UPI00341E6506